MELIGKLRKQSDIFCHVASLSDVCVMVYSLMSSLISSMALLRLACDFL